MLAGALLGWGAFWSVPAQARVPQIQNSHAPLAAAPKFQQPPAESAVFPCSDGEPPGDAVLEAASGNAEGIARLVREAPADALRCVDLFPAATPDLLREAARAAPFDALGAAERLSARPGGADILAEALDVGRLSRALENGMPFYQLRHELRRRLPAPAVQTLEIQASRALRAAFSKDPAQMSGQIGILLDDMSEDPPAERFRIAQALPADSLFEVIAQIGPTLYTSSLDGLFNVLRIQLKLEHRTFLHLATAPRSRAFWARFLSAVLPAGRGDDLFGPNAGNVREMVRISVGALLAPDSELPPPIVASVLADAMSLRSKEARAAFEDEVAERHRKAEDPAVRRVIGLAGALHNGRPSKQPSTAAFQAERFTERYDLKAVPALSEERLFQGGVNLQRMTFYGDRDGWSSFRAFIKERHALGWTIEERGGFVTVSSPERRGRRIVIAADIPGAGDAGRAALHEWLSRQPASPSIVIHRGHSYHEDGTMPEIATATALVFWGSCGGHMRLSATIDQAPDAQVLATQNMGVSTINQALLRIIEDRLLTDGTLDWNAVWRDANARIRDRRFAAYKRPDQDSAVLAMRNWRVR